MLGRLVDRYCCGDGDEVGYDAKVMQLFSAIEDSRVCSRRNP